ncbi:putative receptor-type tyrosine-protein phosphatase alpha [Apostichopus japonicus]|uniref:Putative receptor-type tyrosine-protein phosphatase alpha n=1 Tax=Stichopus japonicus TaxID=307972 RepID=A0A2G8JK52_STIJA|nr:putative receptor-type tyrosine-protein phosphatase alpha [Apostichopus japonicus]
MDVVQTKKEISVFDVIEGMRKDRVNMVLTKLQYLFIFDALLEAMLSPDSQMSCDQLKKLDLSSMKKKSKKEFQNLQETNKIQEDFSCLAGISSENSHKNRFHDILPVDKFRPVLKSPSNLFGSSDYINATIVKSVTEYWPGGQGGTGTNGLMTVICKKIEKSDVFTRRQFEVNHKRSQVHHQ